MPYIKQELRDFLDPMISEMTDALANADDKSMDGELNYVVTRLLKGIYGESYFEYNRAMGVLESIKQEFYRRVVAPYEDTKKEQNGDV